MNQSDRVIYGSIDHMRVRGLLFDVDGTLSDTDDHMVDRIARQLSPLAFLFVNNNPRKTARWLVMAAETPANFIYALANRLGIDAPLAGLYSHLSKGKYSKRVSDDSMKIIKGVREMLERLSSHFPMAVVSARDAETTLQILNQFDLVPYFETIVTAQTCSHTKPFPEPIIYAADRLKLKPEACLMIGDTIVDIRAGKAAGAQTAAVLCGFGTARELKRVGADLILPATPDIANILLD